MLLDRKLVALSKQDAGSETKQCSGTEQ
jgi:hypothetical protein